MEKLIDSLETLEIKIKEIKQAQKIFSTYSQDMVDRIFKAAAIAANQNRILLAKMAVEETGMGVVEDKVIKNILLVSIYIMLIKILQLVV